MNSYELVYALVPNLPEEESNAMHQEIKSYITDNKGEIKAVNDWGLKRLAYPIQDCYEAPYFMIEFDIIPAAIDELKNIIRLNDASLRFAIIKINKDFSKRKMPRKRKPAYEPKKEYKKDRESIPNVSTVASTPKKEES
ncbi:MAG: 30S ribosomal protein S6 [bacterium]|nr:30S ribosomal protein S6 [bacterium]